MRVLLAEGASSVIEHDRLRLDPASHELRRDGVPVPLSLREFALLHALLVQRGESRIFVPVELA